MFPFLIGTSERPMDVLLACYVEEFPFLIGTSESEELSHLLVALPAFPFLIGTSERLCLLSSEAMKSFVSIPHRDIRKSPPSWGSATSFPSFHSS